MNLLSLGYQGVTGQSIGIFAADQGTDPADLRILNIELRAVAERPYQLFSPCGKKLSMVADHVAFPVEQQGGIPHCPKVGRALLADTDG